MMKILIPNATNSRNIGDQAALGVLLGIVKKNLPNARVAVHTSQPEWYSQQPVAVVRDTIYSWILFPSENILNRILKLSVVLGLLLFWLLGLRIKTYTRLDAILKDYTEADIILFCGGGYLRSKSGLRESFNLLLLSLPFLFAKNTRAKTILAPTGFGPFAEQWQAKFYASLLNHVCNIIMVRESISAEYLRTLGVGSVNESCDLALLEEEIQTLPVEHEKLTLGITIRNWLPEREQRAFEEKISSALSMLAGLHNYVLQPIVQVQAPEFGDDDLAAVERVIVRIESGGAQIAPTILLQNVAHAQDVYSKLDAILGMRMHSNIIAATQGVPFVAISYEYKTQGIADMLNMGKYCVHCESVQASELAEILCEVFEQRKVLSGILSNRLGEINMRERRRWENIFHQLNKV